MRARAQGKGVEGSVLDPLLAILVQVWVHRSACVRLGSAVGGVLHDGSAVCAQV